MPAVRILLDYRPALRQRTGVGEFVHELARALAHQLQHPPGGDELALWSSSWKDRPDPSLRQEMPGISIVDRRVPVRGLTWSWNRLEWPPVDWLAGRFDVVHSQTPLLIPSRQAAQVVTIHDLDFLKHPERTSAEMRRDFPALVRDHARRAHAVVVSSRYAASEVAHHLGLDAERIAVCSPGAPAWAAEVAQARGGKSAGDYLLFLGTVEPRKNVAGVLEAYALLRQRRPDTPRLVVGGRVTPAMAELVDRTSRGPLQPFVEFRGYIPDAARPALYREARLLVLPSFEEGFGLPVLEAMACGVPVVISNRGSLPEVAGDAASPVDPDDIETLASRLEELLEPRTALRSIERGLARASTYRWSHCAASALTAYRSALARRRAARA